MRQTAGAVVVLLLTLVAVPAFAVSSRSVVDDVIRMSKSGVADETILDFVNKAGRYDVTADDVIAMSEANVPRNVIRAVVKDADSSSPGSRDRVRDRETVYVAPSYVPVYGYGYWPYYDPWWYGPSVYLNFGFGGWYGHRGGYGGGHHGGFRHHR